MSNPVEDQSEKLLNNCAKKLERKKQIPIFLCVWSDCLCVTQGKQAHTTGGWAVKQKILLANQSVNFFLPEPASTKLKSSQQRSQLVICEYRAFGCYPSHELENSITCCGEKELHRQTSGLQQGSFKIKTSLKGVMKRCSSWVMQTISPKAMVWMSDIHIFPEHYWPWAAQRNSCVFYTSEKQWELLTNNTQEKSQNTIYQHEKKT